MAAGRLAAAAVVSDSVPGEAESSGVGAEQRQREQGVATLMRGVVGVLLSLFALLLLP